jgi:hypothetical protein
VFERSVILFEDVDEAQRLLADDREADGVGQAGAGEAGALAAGVAVVAELELLVYRGLTAGVAAAGPGFAQGQPGTMGPLSGRQ